MSGLDPVIGIDLGTTNSVVATAAFAAWAAARTYAGSRSSAPR